jgi:hypothetical protein
MGRHEFCSGCHLLVDIDHICGGTVGHVILQVPMDGTIRSKYIYNYIIHRVPTVMMYSSRYHICTYSSRGPATKVVPDKNLLSGGPSSSDDSDSSSDDSDSSSDDSDSSPADSDPTPSPAIGIEGHTSTALNRLPHFDGDGPSVTSNTGQSRRQRVLSSHSSDFPHHPSYSREDHSYIPTCPSYSPTSPSYSPMSPSYIQNSPPSPSYFPESSFYPSHNSVPTSSSAIDIEGHTAMSLNGESASNQGSELFTI